MTTYAERAEAAVSSIEADAARINEFKENNTYLTEAQSRAEFIAKSALATLAQAEAGTANVVIDAAVLSQLLQSYAASDHTHSQYASSSHSHSQYAASSHNHSAANITSGTMAAARLPSATTSAKGIVEEATEAEMTAGTGGKFPDCTTVKNYVQSYLLSGSLNTVEAWTGNAYHGTSLDNSQTCMLEPGGVYIFFWENYDTPYSAVLSIPEHLSASTMRTELVIWGFNGGYADTFRFTHANSSSSTHLNNRIEIINYELGGSGAMAHSTATLYKIEKIV